MGNVLSTVVIWGRDGCSGCQQLKADFNEHEIAYEWIDVEGRDYLRDVLQVKYGVRHVPVVEIGGDKRFEAVTDGDFNKIQEILSSSHFKQPITLTTED